MGANNRFFRLDKFQVCQLTGSTLIEASYMDEGLYVVLKKEFTSSQSAFAYVRQESQSWFVPRVHKFIIHKKHLITDEKCPKFSYIKTLNLLAHQFERMNIFECVLRFLKNKDLFYQILPHTENPSYQSSLETLTELEKFANHFTNLKINI